MKKFIGTLTFLMISAVILGALYQHWRRTTVFARQGTAQTMVIGEAKGSTLTSLLPPRMLYIYSGRIGGSSARIETAKKLRSGESVPVLYLRDGAEASVDGIGGRVDRLIPPPGIGTPAWVAIGHSQNPIWQNALADLPRPEGLFVALCAMAIVLWLSPDIQFNRAKRNRVHPVLIPSAVPEPQPGTPSVRINMPQRPPPLPEPNAEEPVANLALPKRPRDKV